MPTAAPKGGTSAHDFRQAPRRSSAPQPVGAALLSHASIQRALADPRALAGPELVQLQRLIGNRAMADLISRRTVPAADPVYSHVEVGPEGGDASAQVENIMHRTQSGGRALPETVRRKVEDHTGQSYADVRVHTGTEAATVNNALGARAATHGKHIYLAQHESPHDLQLMAHELTHVTQQTGGIQRKGVDANLPVKHRMPASRISTKKQLMYLDFVRMKRQDQDTTRIIKKKLGMKVKDHGDGTHDTYGHWWTEIGKLRGGDFAPKESYGWWPKDGAPGSLGKLFSGVEGALNQAGPTSTKDPHQGDQASVEFHPAMEVDPATETYDQIQARVTQDIRNFAQNYSGKWNWKLGWGKNCHTFQQKLKTKVGLHYTKAKSWLTDPAVEEEKQAAVEEEKARDEAKKNIVGGKIYTVPDGLTMERRTADGTELRGGYRGGTQVGATGKRIPHTWGGGGKTELVEYVVMESGERFFTDLAYWNMYFGEDYPKNTDTTDAQNAPTNLGTGGNSLILDLDGLF